MKIDEAIEQMEAKSRYVESTIAKENWKQIAEWLEEYKYLKEVSNSFFDFDAVIQIECKKAVNKAINDFIHECEKYCGFYSDKNRNLTREDVLNIAERLKGKMNNEFI